ncbi:hypothetical protein SAMN05216490_2056 [Mucilaginibacter mallensis]|uniref:Uncharacterized protein n=1 Tax=Mucilaginibacter mallensis TaxID=652787 RepID=A0A1H1W0U0_MUCMA|nr:hypothetical protein [Mucilaginibacter mallensis]SDS90330.1 hypothetical protein SAMN05216490_2056 [Mucilaginibacter mallensis]
MKKLLFILILFTWLSYSYAKPIIYINEVTFDSNAPKSALIGDDQQYIGKISFNIIDAITLPI